MKISTQHYPIWIGEERSAFSALLQSYTKGATVVLVDNNTREHCLPILWEMMGKECPIIEIPAGEIHKNIDSCQYIWQELMRLQLGRDALLLNLGGGVIGDMGGFCAATFKRGIDFIQIPTTLLSQVDASVGGKLGIDFQNIKNGVGLFAYPTMVWIDPIFLQTLPELEVRSGYAEVLKHALIQDAQQWQQLSSLHWNDITDGWDMIIQKSVKIKRDIVEEDPYEKGRRKALNFGHTIGHAVEGVLLHKETPLLHGEAVALGMVCEAYLSHKKLALPLATLEQITETLLRQYGKINLLASDMPAMLSLMRNDKKNEGQTINVSLLSDIGEVVINQTISEEEAIESMQWYADYGL